MNSHYKIDRTTAEMIRDAAKGATLWDMAVAIRAGQNPSGYTDANKLWNRMSNLIHSFNAEPAMVSILLDPDTFTDEQRDFLDMLSIPVVLLDENGVEVSR